MRQSTACLTGIGIGTTVMFLFDPTSGARRRRRLAHFFSQTARATTKTAGKVGRDVSNRTRGVLAFTRRWTTGEQMPSDAVLHDRVRVALSRVASHPHAIHVDADEGRVVLSGQALQAELDNILQAVRGVFGVVDVDSRLEADANSEDVSAPQSQSRPSRKRTRKVKHS
jgi:osmotically-inducible protein OsmY